MPTLTIVRRDLYEEPALFIRRHIPREQLRSALAECLAKVHHYCRRAGHPIEGRPFTRFASTGPKLWTIEVGKPICARTKGEGEIEAGVLAGGPAAVAVHVGPHERLADTHAALARWIVANGLRAIAAPWESYVTSDADRPETWRTKVYWPIAE